MTNEKQPPGYPDGEPDRRTPDDQPDTPPDEPQPPPVKDPPPAKKGPYITGPGDSGSGQSSQGGKQSGLRVGGGARVNGEKKERRGFASMTPEKQREIASKGGRAAHQKGTAHEWTSDEARQAGRKGGQVSRGGRGRLIVPTPNVVGDAVMAGGDETPTTMPPGEAARGE